MHVFHSYLKAVKETGFRYLHFLAEAFDKVFIHNAVGGSEEGKDMAYEFSFFRFQTGPVSLVLK